MGFLKSLNIATLGLSMLYAGSSADLIERQALGPPATLPAGWSYKGCYTDAVGRRTLQNASFASGNQNAETCIDFCSSAGYSLAGTEYSSECYCGNAIASTGGPAPNGAGCNMACNGAAGEACGGPDRLSVYERTSTSPAQSSGIVIEDGTDFVWNARGCYSDLTYARILAQSVAVQGGGQNNSAQSCTIECRRQNFKYAGTEYAAECFCGNTLNNNHVPVDSSGCNMRCNGNNKQFCGGPDRINLYEYIEKPKSTSGSSVPSTTSSTSSPSITTVSSTAVTLSSSVIGSTSSDQQASTSSLSSSSSLSGSPLSSSNSASASQTTSDSAVSAGQNSTISSVLSTSTVTSTLSNSTTSAQDNSTSTLPTVLTASTASLLLNMTSTATTPSPVLSTSVLQNTTTSASLSTTTTSLLNSTTTTSLTASTSASLDSTTTPASLNATTTVLLNSSTTFLAQSSTTSKPPNATITDTVLVSSVSVSLNTTTSIAQNASASISSGANSSTTSVESLNATTTTAVGLDSTSALNSTSVIPTPTPTPKVGWFYEGCYVDGAGGRSLPNAGAVQGGMTGEKCRAACRAAGYVLAGTEYSAECFCGNKLMAGGAPAPDGEAQCNMACNGNQTEICGGPNRLSLWKYYTGNELPGSSTTVLSSSSAAPVPTGLPTGFEYKGCYVDGPGYRVMQNQQPGDDKMTVSSCANACVKLGYDVAGMEYHTQCFCDTMLRMGAKLATNDNQCNTPCGGNSAQMCGGGDRLSIYSSQKTLKIIQKAAPVQKVGNWTYQGCATSTGLDWNKPLPWKLANSTGNSPEWCLSKCAKYGYMAGGMEYGEECYCGDIEHMVEKGSKPAPESECNTACPGNPEAICGQGNRLTWYKWTGDPLYVFNYPQGGAAGRYEFLVSSPVIPLISQPLVNGKVSFLEKHGTGINGTGAYELDPSVGSGTFREMEGLKTDVFCAASLTLPDRAGRVINVGGWSGDSLFGLRLYWPDGKLGTDGKNDWQEDFNALSLQTTRWYPTSLIMPNGSILVVGGENGSNGPPVPNMEILPQVGPLKHAQYLLDTDPYNLYPFLAVLPSGGIFMQYYNEARILDERSLDTIKILPKAPATINDDKGGRTYPLEGTMVLLPQVAPYSEPLEVLLCGGAGIQPAWGIDNCVTIQPDAPNAEWTIERMPSRRVLTCMVTLPDGTFMILNGAEEGYAGFALAKKPNLNALLYDPKKPKHQRISVMANTTIARMYHSEAVLLDDGRILVSGSDPQDEDNFPQEYRLEVFQPPYLLSGKPRPAFTIENKDWMNGVAYPFTITAGGSNIKVSLLGSEASTHGNSMGARVLFPAVSCSGSSCSVTAPPGPYVAPPGWYRMFVLNDDIPSQATWVRIGGDPARLGDWPNVEAFKPLPGVGPVKDLNTSPSTTKPGGQKFKS